MENLHEVSVDDHVYKICLPNAETDYIQGKILSEGKPYEHGMLKAMLEQISPNNLVLDVGANVGNHSLYLACVGGCTVEAFEPNHDLCLALRNSIEANDLADRVRVNQVGVSSSPGYAYFDHMDESNLGAQSLQTSDQKLSEVKLVRLDDQEWRQPVSMMKVDVEGMELDVLEGAILLLQRDKPVLYIEAHGVQDFEKTYDILSSLGYIYCETYNATPTHCFVHESKIKSPRDLAAPLLEKARNMYRTKERLEELKGGYNTTRKSLSDAKEKYRDACKKIISLQEEVFAISKEHQEISDRHNEVSAKYRSANAKYRNVSQQLSALKSSPAYKAGLYVKAASSSFSAAVKLPIRLWRLKKPQKNLSSQHKNLNQCLRYIKWKIVVPCATRIGIPYRKVAHLSFPKSAKHQTLVQKSQSSSGARKEPDAFTPPSAAAQEISIRGWPEQPSNGKPYVISIMDEFTSGCFEQDVNLIQPRPDNWYALAEKYRPEFFFIESAWKGNYGSWQYRVADYTNKPGPEVAHICQYARKKGIPTLFWNKEDPVHHEKFMCSAKLVDHIFTTDANMKESYRAKTGNFSVHALPFAAQPALHKPAPLEGRNLRVCFAGSWYGNRHAERGEAMRWLLEAANPHGLDIYDRNYGTGIFPFPEEYQAGIKGSLPYKKLCDEYSRYRVFLNVNSVTDSPTMFSRRVFELMACGTPVVSTYAKGIENLFGSDVVWMVNSQEEANEALHTLMTDDVEWRRRSLAGIREVFAKHTYNHRLNDIFEKLDNETRIPTNSAILLVADAKSQAELEALNQFAQQQSYRHFRLGIECPEGFEGLASSLNDNVVLLQSDGKASWINQKQTEYPITGWLSPHSHYGEHYLRDLANASLYEPEATGWAKSEAQDRFAYDQPAMLAGALWKTSEFVAHYINFHLSGNPNANVQGSKLFVIDSDQFQSTGEKPQGGS